VLLVGIAVGVGKRTACGSDHRTPISRNGDPYVTNDYGRRTALCGPPAYAGVLERMVFRRQRRRSPAQRCPAV